MLQQRGTPPHQRRLLFTSAAELAAMAGWCSYDSADYGLAQRYMTQALGLCAEGGDRVLGGQILAGMSHPATSLGNPAAALVHRDLGESAKAERLPSASVRANTDRRRRQAISHSVLATALFQQNRLDEAVGTATRVLDQLGDVHSEASSCCCQTAGVRLIDRWERGHVLTRCPQLRPCRTRRR